MLPMSETMDRIVIDRLGFTLLHDPPEAPTANVIFVHGLHGHPRFRWEYTSTSPSATSSSPSVPHTKRRLVPSRVRNFLRRPSPDTTQTPDPEKTIVCWPVDRLPEVLPSCRIWTYGYNADVAGFWGKNNQNNVLKHANDLMIRLERTLKDDVRAKHRPRA
ncbi:hypothetical protein N656DRAFT_452290 [Canariomyces notabilis]|uniref:Uncharacterized protein n=1 Tax=Canariomyces notabilis TaxID=2074819 RepID=A0AAN6QDA7_9PEZI|nr:hypothetical protein N656DRAFT_452290 [Canariomyces arenarius]